MLVQRVLELIRNILEEEKPVSCDVILLDHLSSHFSNRPSDEDLSKEDFQFLLACYKSRWESIIDSDNDYTLNPSRVNHLWIAFARELEPIVKQNYLKILIPTLINEIDINDFSPLTETVNLHNFYLGYGGNTLYRKLSFCKHLESGQFVLSTYRNCTERMLNVVSVEELARLKLCKQTSKPVTIGDERFEHFWDLMRKKVFVHLADKGHLPIALLPHLLELIERYYLLQANGSDFSVFKAELKNLFRRLQGYEIADANALYGAKVEYKETEQYLLDVFIDLQTAKDFSEIKIAIETLSKWLFHFNPSLRASCKELEAMYGELHDKKIAYASNNLAKSLENSCSLLVSLLTTKFKFNTLLTRQFCNLWDHSNAVPPELNTIFEVLLPLIVANKPELIAEAYDQIIQSITSTINDKSWYTSLTRTEATSKWLEFAQNSQFAEIGGCWYQSETLFAALTLFNTNNQSLKARIHIFLDDLIQTHAQDQNDLMKQFRVNILFSEFLKELNQHHRMNLLRLVKLCDPKIAKSRFLHNSSIYIKERLIQLSPVSQESRSLSFFPQQYKLDSAKLFRLPEEMKDMSSIIADYKNQFLTIRQDAKILDTLGSYLIKIGQPILTLEQKEMIRNSGRALDYIGQYT